MHPLIYTSAAGTVLVRDAIIDTFPFSDETAAVDDLLIVSRGELTETERKVLQKHPDALFVNWKKDQQQASPEQIQHVLLLLKQHASTYYFNTLLLTKKMIASSVSFETLTIQASNAIDELTKVTNLLAKRLREWYELFNPEFSKAVHDHAGFAKLLLQKKKEELLQEIGYAQKITMGASLAEKDVAEIFVLARELLSLYATKERYEVYIASLLQKHCPNMVTIAGALITAKMLAITGSLQRLATLPSSTVQLLGAEKALFRHMKTGAKPPKYGFLLQHPLVAQAKKQQRGKVARAIADKLSLCAKVDYYKGAFIADKLMIQLQTKINGL